MTQLGYPTSSEAMARRLGAILADPSHGTWVAEDRGRIVGMVGVCTGHHYARDGSYGRIVALSVSEDFRGRGVGRELVRRAEAWVRSRGGRRMVVNTRASRDGARRFYRRLGYDETGLRFARQL